MISEKIIKTEKTARFYHLGNPSNKIKNVWFVLHGYGQLAKEFILNFSVLMNDETLIIAPEAMNKFYLRGFSGKVGANWMTKEDRANEIKDYLGLLTNVYNEISIVLDLENVKINVLGFSQGTHTTVRWLNNTKIKIDNLLLWSGAFPHDCNYIQNTEYWSNVKTKIVLGNEDRLISEEFLKTEIDYLKSQKIKIDLIKYPGGHKIEVDQLSKIIKGY